MSSITQRGYENLFAAIFGNALKDDLEVGLEDKSESIFHMAEVEADKLLIHHSTVRRVLREQRSYIKNEIANYLIIEARDYPHNPIKRAIDNRKKLAKYLVKKMLEK